MASRKAINEPSSREFVGAQTTRPNEQHTVFGKNTEWNNNNRPCLWAVWFIGCRYNIIIIIIVGRAIFNSDGDLAGDVVSCDKVSGSDQDVLRACSVRVCACLCDCACVLCTFPRESLAICISDAYTHTHTQKPTQISSSSRNATVIHHPPTSQASAWLVACPPR